MMQPGQTTEGFKEEANPAKGTGPRLPLMAFVEDEVSLENIRAMAEEKHWPLEPIRQGRIDDAIERLKTQRSPKFLIVDIQGREDPIADIEKLADVCEPDIKVVVVGHKDEYSFFCTLQEMGIAGYYLPPVTEAQLQQAFEGVNGSAMNIGAGEGRSEVVTVIGVRGGVGATTLAANLGWYRSHEHKLPTVLLDPDPHFGALALHFDTRPSPHFKEIMEGPQRLDQQFLERITSKVSDDLFVISAEEAMEQAVRYHPEAMDMLLKEMTRRWASVVMDMPRRMDAQSKAMLARSTRIVVVSDVSVAGLRDTMRLVDLLEHRFGDIPRHFVLNHVHDASGGMTKAQFEKHLETEVTVEIPYDKPMLTSTNAGKPILQSQPSSKSAQAIRELAIVLTGEEQAAKAHGLWMNMKHLLSLGK